ncbi:hypothetical protein HK44_022870 [Pseudomonas fluorescens HK44]|uniref:Uncharacterized protein n=2 Tax=Pseudomonas fluorescens TaxID=294 RepID=A0A010SUF3_PSEFL|nr:hypothetical protein HK44_022870 [Pseudomonas fluorescens HK44]
MLRARSNSTLLPSKGFAEIKASEQEKKLNVFDQSPYKEIACKNKQFELKLGEGLSCSKELELIAKSIREATGSPMRFADFSQEQQEKILSESAYIGGAKELIADVDCLDAHVLATLIKAEGKEYEMSEMERRKCMFNYVRSPDNVIYPWNNHSFDMEIFEVGNPIQFTEQMRGLIVERWSELLEKESDIEDYLYDKLGVSPVNLNNGVIDIIQIASESDRKKLLKEAMKINWSTSRFIADENNSRESNPLGGEFRQHTVGARSNVVRVSDKEDPNVNKWVFEAVVNGKPVTSGPSGHTLRYLNHYAMCSEMLQLSNYKGEDLPSLEEARLVMLANLMAPKDHHSYHEVMLASVGIYNGEEMLEYRSKDSYDDLKTTRIGRAAFAYANEGVSG